MKETKPINDKIDNSQQEQHQQTTTSKLPKKRRLYNITNDDESTNNNVNINNSNMQITQNINNDVLDEYIEVDDNINSSNN